MPSAVHCYISDYKRPAAARSGLPEQRLTCGGRRRRGERRDRRDWGRGGCRHDRRWDRSRERHHGYCAERATTMSSRSPRRTTPALMMHTLQRKACGRQDSKHSGPHPLAADGDRPPQAPATPCQYGSRDGQSSTAAFMLHCVTDTRVYSLEDQHAAGPANNARPAACD